MPFLLLVFLSLACLPEPGRDWPEPPWGAAPWLSAALTALAVGVVVFYAWWITVRVRHDLAPDFQIREAVLTRYERGRSRHQWLLLSLYVLSLLVFGWGDAVGRFWRSGDRLLPLAELVVLAPFLLSLVLSWVFFYDAERAQWSARHLDEGLAIGLMERDGAVEATPSFSAVPRPVRVPDSLASRFGYVLFQVRQKLALVSIPLALLLGQKEITRLVSEDASHRWDVELHILGFVAVLGAFITMPWVLRLVLGLTPMADGPLTRRLLAATKRLGFRCSGLLLWNTRRGMANAMVVGVIPWPRYVIFTDRLLEEFTPEEVEAVLGHEIGHIRHRHMPYYLTFLLASIMVVFLALARFFPGNLDAGSPAEPENAAVPASFFALPNHAYLKFLPPIAVMLGYIFVVFGFLSRRCERQADVFGCRAVSCPRDGCTGHEDGAVTGTSGHLCATGIGIFIQALEKVADVNGLSRDRPGVLQSWQHSTIAKRVRFLESIRRDPTVEKRFQRRVFLLKCGLLTALGLAGAALLLL